jgi:hypothetical protein
MSFFYLFSSAKLKNRKAEQVLQGVGVVSTSEEGRWWGKGKEDEYCANNVYTCN